MEIKDYGGLLLVKRTLFDFAMKMYGFFENNYQAGDSGSIVQHKLEECLRLSEDVEWPGSCKSCEKIFVKYLSLNLLNFKLTRYNEDLTVGSFATIRETNLFNRRQRR